MYYICFLWQRAKLWVKRKTLEMKKILMHFTKRLRLRRQSLESENVKPKRPQHPGRTTEQFFSLGINGNQLELVVVTCISHTSQNHMFINCLLWSGEKKHFESFENGLFSCTFFIRFKLIVIIITCMILMLCCIFNKEI